MQEPGHRLVEMAARILPLLHRMGGPGIGHHREGLVVLNELVHQLLEGLIMAFRLIDPPPLDPHDPTRFGSRYGRAFKTDRTAAACSQGSLKYAWLTFPRTP